MLFVRKALLLLHWRHNTRDGVSNHLHLDCVFDRLFRRISKKTPKLHVIGLCEGKPPLAGGFPSQMASDAENVSFDDVIMEIVFCGMPSWFSYSPTPFLCSRALSVLVPNVPSPLPLFHDDVIKWKRFQRNWPFWRGIHRSFDDVFCDLRLNKRLSKQSWCWWFETLSRSLWRHCNVTDMD